MYSLFLKAKEERIDKQYYISPLNDELGLKESAEDMINLAAKFNPQILAYKNKLRIEDIQAIREKINEVMAGH